MLIRQILAALLLLSLSIGTSSLASVLLSGNGDANQHSSDQPLTDGEEENEKPNFEWDESEVLFCGLLTTAAEQLPTVSFVLHHGPHSSTLPTLSGPDHSRAPPARV